MAPSTAPPSRPSSSSDSSSSGGPQRLGLGQTLLVGSLLFGLFFGAGNLIFPVEMGRAAGSATTAATVGFLVTAVGLPVLGVIASALSRSSNVLDMVSLVGRPYAIAFTCALYLTIGPLFAIPRTATVSYEVGVAPSLPGGASPAVLLAFTLVFFCLTGLAALRPGRLVDYVGRYLTPLFLVLLAALVGAAFLEPMTTGPLQAPAAAYADGATARGFLDGYNTMDALASLAFAIVLIEALRGMGVTRPGAIARETAKGSIVSMLAMAAIYGSLAYVGATSLTVTAHAENGGGVLAGVSQHYYGTAGRWLVGAIVVVACLKTAIGLVTACAEMFDRMFPGVMPYRAWAMIFTVVSCAIANVGLSTIIAWSIPVLMFLYPLAIVAIVLALLTRWLGDKPVVHRTVTSCVALAAVLDLVKALPTQPPGAASLLALGGRLPGFEHGFGWVVPALLGLVVGLVLQRRTARVGRQA